MSTRPLPDRLRRGLRLVVCGVNPSPASADARIGYFRQGNRFWPAALAAGLVTADRDPDRAARVDRVGFTDFVARVEADQSTLATTELRVGAAEVEEKIRRYQPAAVLFTSITAFRSAVWRKAVVGVQPQSFGGRPAYVMPSTSGRNASVPLTALVEHMRAAVTLADTAAAARANAKWCASQGGVRGRATDTYWYAPRRTADFYPDAVTLHPFVDPDEMLGKIDLSPGASVKDSFATLDLSSHGFEVLLEGHWYAGDYGPRGDYDWFTADESPADATPIAPMRVWIKRTP
ncbi:MAG TPA: mismatch-specific DNA-glycosylase [Acidimicrobiales bacterium]|nr:mismatch-specific DNA-glycosylase [Acidimicrobiales bacterium]